MLLTVLFLKYSKHVKQDNISLNNKSLYNSITPHNGEQHKVLTKMVMHKVLTKNGHDKASKTQSHLHKTNANFEMVSERLNR